MKNSWLEKASTKVKDENFHQDLSIDVTDWKTYIDTLDYQDLKQIDEETRFCRVYVNGVVRGVKPSKMAYRDIVNLAPGHFRDDTFPSVTYHGGVDGKDGILSPGRFVDVIEGTVFNVCFTGNA